MVIVLKVHTVPSTRVVILPTKENLSLWKRLKFRWPKTVSPWLLCVRLLSSNNLINKNIQILSSIYIIPKIINLALLLNVFYPLLLFRLLDVVHGPRLYNEKCMTLYLVFEHIEQDLATYMARCPKPGMSSEIIKVSKLIL